MPEAPSADTAVTMRMRTTRRARLGLAVLVAASTIATVGAATTGRPAYAAEPTPEVRVLSANVMLLPPLAYRNETRADMIAAADWIADNDVVVVQEAFENSAADRLLNGLNDKYPHQTPIVGRTQSGWDHTLGAWSAGTPQDGGVAIVSRWPITERTQFLFKRACGADNFALKGFAYARLDVKGTPVHVVGLHAQSQDGGCSTGQAESVRAHQFDEMHKFLDEKQIPAQEQVIITGDFNVIKESAEYGDMISRLAVKEPTAFKGLRYSFDPTINTLTRYRYPTDKPEQLDYVLYRSGNAGSGIVNTLHVKSPEWSDWRGNVFTDYTDHFPVRNY